MSLHICVGMSGGVDSSVTALLLKQQGHHVTGIFMKNWESNDEHCPASIDLADAQAVCDRLGIELQQVNFAEEYWEKVFSHFLAEFKAGRTPNPDILCNREIKFKAFLRLAQQRGADKIATGHYAGTISHEQGYSLIKSADLTKDQSYFLHALDQQQLANSLFPLATLSKSTVRHLAKDAGLINYAKKDSTGICFIGERKFKPFLQDFLPAMPGPIQTLDGETLGEHEGLMFYTLGQRQGLKIGGQRKAQSAPWYIVSKNVATNSLIVSQDETELYCHALITPHIHWIAGVPPSFPFSVTAKTRYRQLDQACMIEYHSQQGNYHVTFEKAQRAITPGQYVVFYKDNVCLGGGKIMVTVHRGLNFATKLQF